MPCPRFHRFFALALFLIPAWARAQSSDVPAEPKLYLGLRAGYSNYTITGTEVDLHTRPGADQVLRVPGLTAGAVVRRRLYKPLSAQCEVLYVREGGNFTRRVFTGKSTYDIDCVQVPLLLDVRLGGPSGPALHLQGGVAFVAVVNGVELDATSFAPGNRFNNQGSFWAQAYGAELAWAHERRVYTLTARFTQDLTDYYQRDYQGTPYHARSHGFSISAGMLFAQQTH
ncbi:outer membrane beta-barrel protein [Hymenobacter properus]|uniref:Outer membrane beta-barrel protein n=1 Tax=Hymenobacter properus TaxID=2791026 RepID=A0A931BFZ7_9BACT|nr:outer membrane beta-barrel protein [Hymenobacter properus]MBF9141602.1 outer membrane beta-barrel protein [Hymenobacter properus]MBR7720411.1 outer membrane beta-barrel protein [Microvirga sp. SRT04]